MELLIIICSLFSLVLCIAAFFLLRIKKLVSLSSVFTSGIYAALFALYLLICPALLKTIENTFALSGTFHYTFLTILTVSGTLAFLVPFVMLFSKTAKLYFRIYLYYLALISFISIGMTILSFTDSSSIYNSSLSVFVPLNLFLPLGFLTNIMLDVKKRSQLITLFSVNSVIMFSGLCLLFFSLKLSNHNGLLYVLCLFVLLYSFLGIASTSFRFIKDKRNG